MELNDWCYLCEIGKDGVLVPHASGLIRVCSVCLLDCIYRHPKLILWHRKPELVPQEG